MNRKLASLAGGTAVVVAAAAITAGTFAQFHDDEVTKNDRLGAKSGTLDLVLGGSASERQNVSSFNPGDSKSFELTLHNDGNTAGDLLLTLARYGDDDNGCTEPEREAGDLCDPDIYDTRKGELSQYLVVTLTGENGNSISGKLSELTGDNLDLGKLGGDAERTVTVNMELPKATGNIVQSDATSFYFTANLEQHTEPSSM